MRTRTLLTVMASWPLWALAQPANNDCANPQLLLVHATGECPALSTIGNNELATGVDAPACDTTSTFFKDVWYAFSSGTNTEILIDFTFITIDEWGVEVLDACGGTSIFCDSTAAQYTVPVVPSASYRLRVFSNADFGSGGVFTICLSGDSVLAMCDGAEVLSDFGTLDIDVCKDSVPDMVDFGSSTSSSEAYGFLLTDTNDLLIAAPAPPIDFDILALGAYRMYGISFDGSLTGNAPGTPLSQISSDGQCFELSANSILINVELCSTVEGSEAEIMARIFPNPSSGDFLVTSAVPLENVQLKMFDLSGREVYRSFMERLDIHGQPVRSADRLTPGTYLLVLATSGSQSALRVVVQ